ncbi:hypothetical protein [Rubricoccus marinus]|uniref:Phosphodiester glycosidase domain-containing protein n=1 Tax=Rubricoccus marinus TaxID=716817 RepID=A0A259U1Q3_9BACT|nr:hypothetical protein [Rubricoccus marinus]OZC03866.1 hypothetical protein BSZ36_13250 [Rubricoccus marinus]
MTRFALLLLLAALGCAPGDPDAPPNDPAPEVADALASDLQTRLASAGLKAVTLDVASGEGLEAYALANVSPSEGAYLVQWADLGQVELEQVLSAMVPAPEAEGFFYPAAPSPAFGMMRADSVVAVARGGTGELLAVMNGAFLETPMQPSTRLAFPVASGGEIVTGGSSPNGPGRPGARGRRWDQPLRALAMGTREVRIADVDPASGAPLGADAFADAFASYAPEAHPTRRATRFHVFGALDRDGDGTTETLVAVTNDGTTSIEQTGAVLDALGVAPEARIAPDGGASVFVWNRSSGALHRPTGDQPLPHFLTLRLR